MDTFIPALTQRKIQNLADIYGSSTKLSAISMFPYLMVIRTYHMRLPPTFLTNCIIITPPHLQHSNPNPSHLCA